MNDEFMEEYTRIAEVFRTCCTNYGTEDRSSCDECPYSDLIFESLASNGEVMFCDYTECETALCTRVYEMMEEQALKNLAAYEDTGLTPEEFKESVDFVLELNKKLKPYMNAEEQGLLVRLPCKVGDMVYYRRGRDILGDTVERIIIDGIDNQVLVGAHKVYMFRDFGSKVFLTREEAALKRGQDNG